MRPETEADVAEIIRDATAPLRIRGGGTRQTGQAGPGEVLETGGLSGITLYEPGALTMVVRAGTPLAEVEAALAEENQRLAFEPMDHRGVLDTRGEPTIGGVVAGNVSGPRRIQVGACRDFMLGVRFVDGSGAVVKNGGRVMKNVTGYDLVKLMTGSWGTLGVLTEVSLKVLPRPDTQACLLIEGLSDAEAVSVMARALGSPYEVSGAAHLPAGPDGTPVTLLRVEGFEASVSYRIGKLGAMFSDHARRVEDDPAQVDAEWRRVRDVEAMQGQSGDVWRISVKPSDAPGVAAALKAERLLFDWGGGLIWGLFPEGTDVRARMGDTSGHATLVRGSAASQSSLGVFHPEPASVAALADGLRKRFDPRGLLNPGLMRA